MTQKRTEPQSLFLSTFKNKTFKSKHLKENCFGFTSSRLNPSRDIEIHSLTRGTNASQEEGITDQKKNLAHLKTNCFLSLRTATILLGHRNHSLTCGTIFDPNQNGYHSKNLETIM